MPSHVPNYRLRVLIVDDEPDMRALLAEICRSRDFEVSTAKDGREAVELLARAVAPFDLVVSDVQMPTADGFLVLEAAMRRSLSTRVVLITGYATEAGRARAEAGGAAAYLSKPASILTIAGVLDQLALAATRD